jgi:hypothetical protein
MRRRRSPDHPRRDLVKRRQLVRVEVRQAPPCEDGYGRRFHSEEDGQWCEGECGIAKPGRDGPDGLVDGVAWRGVLDLAGREELALPEREDAHCRSDVVWSDKGEDKGDEQ